MKMQSYFRLNCPDNELDASILNHFNNDLKVDPTEVIDKLLEMKREDKGGKMRGTRPSRAPL